VDIISYEVDDRIGRITISRPDRRNALNHSAIEELQRAVRAAVADDVRALVVIGDEDHFCSGADLTELEDLSFINLVREVLDELDTVPGPTIAAVAGSCIGLGMQIALTCDLRLSTPEAVFGVPPARLGLMVDHQTVQRLAFHVGHSTARWMLLTARTITAQRAYSVGMLHQLVEVGEVGPTASVSAVADDLAREIAMLAPLSTRAAKLGLDLLEQETSVMDPDGSFESAFEAAWRSEDLVEGRRAFVERRRSRFHGR